MLCFACILYKQVFTSDIYHCTYLYVFITLSVAFLWSFPEQFQTEYLNDPAVQAALHVVTTPTPQPYASSLDSVKQGTPYTSAQDNSPSDEVPNSRRWDFCSDEVNENWAANDLFADTTELYRLIYSHKHKPKDFKMLVFSGDIDGVSWCVYGLCFCYFLNRFATR